MPTGNCECCGIHVRDLGKCPVCGDLVGLCCMVIEKRMCLSCVAESKVED